MVVQDIQEVAQYLKLKFKISLQWMDARVSFYNIKVDENMNSLSLDEQLALWTPTIVFWNTEKQLKTVNDKNTFASVRRSGSGSLIAREVNEDIEIFRNDLKIYTQTTILIYSFHTHRKYQQYIKIFLTVY